MEETKRTPTELARDRARGIPDELTFTPITPGLGFHPFSDGLPYAPIGKSSNASGPGGGRPANRAPSPMPVTGVAAPRPYQPASPFPMSTSMNPSMGSGAVAAGRPTFVAPRMPSPMPGVHQPVRPAVPGGTLIPAAHLSAPSALAIAAAAAAAAREELPAALRQPAGETFGFLVRRVTAYVFDTLVNIGLCGAAFAVAIWRQDMNLALFWQPGMLILISLFLLTFNWAVIAAQEIAFGTSLGKWALGLEIQGNVSRLLLRALLFVPSAAFAGLGLMSALFDRDRRCWHDAATDLRPQRVPYL